MNPIVLLVGSSVSRFRRRITSLPCFRRQSLPLIYFVALCCFFTVFLPVFWSAGFFSTFSPFSPKTADEALFTASRAFINADRVEQSQSVYYKPGHPETPFECPVPVTSRSWQPLPTSPASSTTSGSILTGSSKFKLKHNSKVLLLLQSSKRSQLANDLVFTFEWTRLPYRTELIKHSLPYLTRSDLGKYALVIFENASSYFEMDQWNRQLLHTYCRQFGVGLALFVSDLPASASSYTFNLNPGGSDFVAVRRLDPPPVSVMLTNNSDLLRISRPGLIWRFGDPDDRRSEVWNGFEVSNNTVYRTLTSALTTDHRKLIPTVIEDLAMVDGVHRIYFGHSTLDLWLNRVLFLDCLSLLLSPNGSSENFPAPLLPIERYLQIDVDDIFVGASGKRLTPNDVHALLQFQQNMQEKISPNFKLNLGFSGGYYLHGNTVEDEAEQLLVSKADNFNWFHHSWLHRKPHMMTYDKIVIDIKRNMDFAKRFSLPLDRSYAIAPFHSGIYPVHEPLYSAWHDILSIVATATEHSPHANPIRRRRGFVHAASGIKVLPRLSMGIFTKTNYFEDFPGGKKALDGAIQGGRLFNNLLFNPVASFMTHQNNYALDRLGIYAFESLVNFVQCYTRLSIRYLPPSHLANLYFALYPNDTDPVWTNPCDDRNHLELWSPNKTCSHLPDLLIVGPQKTGSTAFHKFLSLHPKTVASKPSERNFEEIQFFSDHHNYRKGLDWYLSFFSAVPVNGRVNNRDSTATEEEDNAGEEGFSLKQSGVLSRSANRSSYVFFEKSATYFDSDIAVNRIKALLPRAKIIVLIENPAKRAYSWYQHQRAKGNRIAMNATFYEVLTQSSKTFNSWQLKSLRNRCLHPGHYAQHFDKWLSVYPASSLYFIDSAQFAAHPPTVLADVQKFLRLDPVIDYNQLLRLDPAKGFYCTIDTVNASRVHCLGSSKGRNYPPMDDASRDYLASYFRPHNLRLLSILRHLGYKIPAWLRSEISTANVRPEISAKEQIN